MNIRLPFSVALSVLTLVFCLIVIVFAPLVAPHGVNEIVGTSWDPPSVSSPFGTDMIGRDLLSRFVWGARVTILTAGAAVLIAFVVGSGLGFLAGLRKGWLDTGLSRVVDLVMAMPTLVLAMVLLTILPRSIAFIVSIIALVEATRFFRLARLIAADTAALDYVEAAYLRGETTQWIIRREILPNAITPLLAEFGLRFIFSVLFLSTLSFLGLGVQPPVADWGSLIKENKDGLLFGITAALVPGAAIAALALAVTTLVDWVSANRGGRPKP
ncbi:ABC transporter permease [Rhizobium rhizogenes]|uniref:ABC transporter permease n=1 Tax=Rhizobium rhizogenes TaxID=359 RepID=UPI0022B71842|nr:ABC transporter permease [Rhizobium rhizogenes]MCZ7448129.1 ABC transporter permease [Rhizobium rhizogenes]MCZ7465790.1 ABC transporter permease [Rhizobium rhizogenes]